MGYPDPFVNNSLPRLTYVLKGIQRAERPTRSGDRRLPILPSVLEALLEVWSANGNLLEHKMLWAACCLGFFGFMRAGEFTATPTQACPLLPADIAVDNHSSPTYLSVHLRRSKTDPFGKGVTLFIGRTYQRICPVAAVLSYMAVRPPTGGPLFVNTNGSPLTPVQLVHYVRMALKQKGWDVSHYSGHSFRIGAATTAAAMGVPIPTIKMLGRWESEAYTRYIRFPREQLTNIPKQLLSGNRP